MSGHDFGFLTWDSRAAEDRMYEPDPAGGFRLRGVKRPAEMSRSEKTAFISTHGLDAWKRLIVESLRPEPTPVGPFASKGESRRYLDEHGLDAWREKMAQR